MPSIQNEIRALGRREQRSARALHEFLVSRSTLQVLSLDLANRVSDSQHSFSELWRVWIEVHHEIQWNSAWNRTKFYRKGSNCHIDAWHRHKRFTVDESVTGVAGNCCRQ